MYILSGIPVIECEKTGEDISLYAERKVRESILSGKAYNSFLDFVSGQGGYLSFIESELSKKYEDIIPNTVFYADYKAEKDGYIKSLYADVSGKASMILGAGRIELDDVIDQYAGIYLYKTVEDKVSGGDVIARLYSSDKDKLKEGMEIFKDAVEISDNKVDVQNDVVIQRFN